MNHDVLTQILNLARWAPSGDNQQPWSFEIAGDHSIRVHGFDTRDHILYDYLGRASHIAHGALLETLRIAATRFALQATWELSSNGEDRSPVYTVTLVPDPGLAPDPLVDYIEKRTVQRRPMKTTPLTSAQRQALLDAAGKDFTVQLFEQASERLSVAKLLWRSAKIRLTCPEAYKVHMDAIEWRASTSKDRIPDQAVGVDPATARLMEWVMKSWKRVEFFNRFLLGTVAPRIQLDLLPPLYCAAHVLIHPKNAPNHLMDWVRAGVAVQRVWLTAAQLGLHLQPQMTPVIFRWYARDGCRFSVKPELFDQALKVADSFETLAKVSRSAPFVFFARVGTSTVPKSRSIRKDLGELMRPAASLPKSGTEH
jgi:hypothetical protein